MERELDVVFKSSVVVGIWHWPQPSRHLMRQRSHFDKGIVSTSSLDKHALSPFGVVECSDDINIMMGRGRKAFVKPTQPIEVANLELDHYKKLLSEQPFMINALGSYINGDSPGIDPSLVKDVFQHSSVSDAYYYRKMHLKKCPARLFLKELPLSFRGLTEKMEAVIVEEGGTIGDLVDSYQEAQMAKKGKLDGFTPFEEGNNNNWCDVPTSMMSRLKERYNDGDDAEEKVSKTLLPIQMRLKSLALGLMSCEEGTAMAMHSDERMFDTLIPFTMMNSTYGWLSGSKLPNQPDQYYFKYKKYDANLFKLAVSKKNGTSIICIDEEDILGLGEGYAFFVLGHYIKSGSTEHSKLMKLREKAGKHNVSIFANICCNYIHDRETIDHELSKGLYLKSEMKYNFRDMENYKTECHEKINPFIQEFLMDAKESFIDSLDIGARGINFLTRFGWLPWCMLADIFLDVSVVSYVFNEGGTHKNPHHTRALQQTSYKKQRISDNCALQYSDDLECYLGFGVDSNVKTVIGIIVSVLLELDVAKDEELIGDYVQVIATTLTGEVGIFANEIIGQICQFIRKGRNDPDQQSAVDEIFRMLVGKKKDHYEQITTLWSKIR
jgi:hypothetical protein